ncbi:MAG TPA: PQQ-binding-like beta-propeller repeat protein [Streptosporangiaceae bacterium]
MGTRRRRPALAAAGLIAILAACSPGGSGGPGRASPAGPTASKAALPGQHAAWPAYHANARRSGFVPGMPAAGTLAIAWSRRLDGAVYGQPLVIGDTVIAATEHDTVYGLSLSTGAIRWSARVGTPLPLSAQPCGDIDPLGITSTPVYYRGLVYVVAQDGQAGHLLAGLSPATGAVQYRRAVPSPDRHPRYDQQRSALAAGNGRIYVAFGGHFGDCGPYVGSVVGVPAAGPGAQARPDVSYLVPSSGHAGIWAPGGPVTGPDGTIYVGIGNGDTSGAFDDSDSVTALSPGLRRTGVFAPANWLADNRNDLDLGSLTPALTASGQLLTVGKRGIGYLLSASHLGGIGGQLGQRRVCPAFGGTATTGSTVIVPCAAGGPAAVRLSGGQIQVAWRGPAVADGSPVIGGHAVWVTGNQAGLLFELNPATGRVQDKIALGAALPHFASPSLAGRFVLTGTLDGVVAVTGG